MSVRRGWPGGGRHINDRLDLSAISLRNFDASTFNAWFIAFTLNSPQKEAIAVRRFRPQFLVGIGSSFKLGAGVPDVDALTGVQVLRHLAAQVDGMAGHDRLAQVIVEPLLRIAVGRVNGRIRR